MFSGVHASVLAFVWLLQPAASHGAFGTARPAECGALRGFGWERAKEPNLRPYCDKLASATTKLVGPGTSVLLKEVPQIADEADKLLPGRASPSVLKGRAFLLLGRPEDALAALREAKKRDERALDDPVALLAWARANARTGNLAEAAQAYRAALPRTSALTAMERSAAAFEAGMTVMAQGPAAIDDAVAMLRQSRRDAQEAMLGASVVALALALDRAGQHDEAKAVLAELGRPLTKTVNRAVFDDPRVTEALRDAGSANEAFALAALAAEGEDAPFARDTWRKYQEGPSGKGPWAEHAREHAGSGTNKPAAPRRGAPR